MHKNLCRIIIFLAILRPIPSLDITSSRIRLVTIRAEKHVFLRNTGSAGRYVPHIVVCRLKGGRGDANLSDFLVLPVAALAA
jgi:hypothetical protein